MKPGEQEEDATFREMSGVIELVNGESGRFRWELWPDGTIRLRRLDE